MAWIFLRVSWSYTQSLRWSKLSSFIGSELLDMGDSQEEVGRSLLKDNRVQCIREMLDVPSGSESMIWIFVVCFHFPLLKQHQAKVIGLPTKAKMNHRIWRLGEGKLGGKFILKLAGMKFEMVLLGTNVGVKKKKISWEEMLTTTSWGRR